MRTRLAIVGTFTLLALVVASVSGDVAVAGKDPEVSSVLEGRDGVSGSAMLVVIGKKASKFRRFLARNTETLQEYTPELALKDRSMLVLRLPAEVPVGTYELELGYGRSGLQVHTVEIGKGDPLPGSITTGALDDSLLADLRNAATLGGEGPSFYCDAGNLSAGVLDNGLFSAYSDLLNEGHVGSLANQLAEGDHDHDGVYCRLDGGALTGALSVAGSLSATASSGTPLVAEHSAAGGSGVIARFLDEGTERARFDKDGGLLLSGEYSSAATIPASGPGTRLMWYPERAAFRAGQVNDAQWDDAGVGAYSVAFGLNTSASSTGAIAAGYGTSASGYCSTAIGVDTAASGGYSVAMGLDTLASGPYSTALGFDNAASGGGSIAAGRACEASGDFSTAIGFDADAGGELSRSLGYFTTASGDHSTAMGHSSSAGGLASVAIGYYAYATGDYSKSLGSWSMASGVHATALGNSTTASGVTSTAMGYLNTASGNDSTAMGHNNDADSYASLFMGRFATTSSGRSKTTWSSSDPLFVCGNGSSASSRSDAFVVYKNGSVAANGTLVHSDRRLKTKIEELRDVLPLLAVVRGVRYEFRDQQRYPAGRQIGVIAQEMREVFPELVRQTSNGTLSVSYEKFTAVLLEAVKEQQRQMEERDRRIEQLEARLTRLEALEQ